MGEIINIPEGMLKIDEDRFVEQFQQVKNNMLEIEFARLNNLPISNSINSKIILDRLRDC